MNYNNHLQPRPAISIRRPPWMFAIFLIVGFFLNFHDLSFATRGIGNYNLSPADLVAVAKGSLVHRISLLLLGIGAMINLVRYRAKGRFRTESSLAWLLIGFVAWAFISPIWADDLLLTIRRLAAFGILCIVAVAFERRFLLREMILWIFFTNGLFIIISILAEVQAGTFQPFAFAYRFGGSMHPNAQGIECGLFLLSAVAAADVKRRRRALFWASAFLGFVLLILTGSRTALAATSLSLVVWVALVCSSRAKFAMALGVAVTSCLLMLVLGAGVVPVVKDAVLLGRDDPGSVDSFSGRTMIWEDVGHFIRQRPILGYGFGGFWTPARTVLISEEENMGVPNSHSAYIDYLLTLGVVGMVAYMLLLVAGIWRAFQIYRRSRSPAFAFLGVLLVFCAFDGILESATVEGSLLMFLFMVALVRVASVPLPQHVRNELSRATGAKDTLAGQEHLVPLCQR